MNWPREAKHLHGDSGILTIEFPPCNVVSRRRPTSLAVYEKEGITNDPEHCVPLKKIDHPLAWLYPEYRIVVTKKVSTCENLCKLFYELLKDKMSIKKITYRSFIKNVVLDIVSSNICSCFIVIIYQKAIYTFLNSKTNIKYSQ
jgi:6-pyruvoyltetrahydropterin/6-carboxytetrahydropterin synthase